MNQTNENRSQEASTISVMAKPHAAAGLASYRYRGQFGWIAIGATNNADAFREAARSTSVRLQPELMEIWNQAGQKYEPALKPVFEAGNNAKRLYAKVFELDSYFKVVAYDGESNIRSGLNLWVGDMQAAIAYAKQFNGD